MIDSERYRYYAADCLLTAKKACHPNDRRLAVSMAGLWLELAKQDETANGLLAAGHPTDGDETADRS
jgi:hypothetical protein